MLARQRESFLNKDPSRIASGHRGQLRQMQASLASKQLRKPRRASAERIDHAVPAWRISQAPESESQPPLRVNSSRRFASES